MSTPPVSTSEIVTIVLAAVCLLVVACTVCGTSTHAVYAWGRPLALDDGQSMGVRRVYYDERTTRFYDV
jgi:hypothetical protein